MFGREKQICMTTLDEYETAPKTYTHTHQCKISLYFRLSNQMGVRTRKRVCFHFHFHVKYIHLLTQFWRVIPVRLRRAIFSPLVEFIFIANLVISNAWQPNSKHIYILYICVQSSQRARVRETVRCTILMAIQAALCKAQILFG